MRTSYSSVKISIALNRPTPWMLIRSRTRCLDASVWANCSPNRGASAQALAQIFDPAFGGEDHYFRVRSFAKLYQDLFKKRLLLGLRLDGQFTGGDVPFYALPYIDMRGIPAMRYQGQYAFVTEGQAMWNCYRRWYLLGFIGSGWAVNSASELALDSAEISKGFGFRYLLARLYGLRVGIDVARGPEEWAFYVQVGNAGGRSPGADSEPRCEPFDG